MPAPNPGAAVAVREHDDQRHTDAAPRTVNKYRCVIVATFSYGCKPSTFALPATPPGMPTKRREPHPGTLVFYTPEEVEAIARALEEGRCSGVALAWTWDSAGLRSVLERGR